MLSEFEISNEVSVTKFSRPRNLTHSVAFFEYDLALMALAENRGLGPTLEPHWTHSAYINRPVSLGPQQRQSYRRGSKALLQYLQQRVDVVIGVLNAYESQLHVHARPRIENSASTVQPSIPITRLSLVGTTPSYHPTVLVEDVKLKLYQNQPFCSAWNPPCHVQNIEFPSTYMPSTYQLLSSAFPMRRTASRPAEAIYSQTRIHSGYVYQLTLKPRS